MNDAVTIEEYNPAWPQTFVEEARRVRAVLGDVRIEHHGSTAVPGLPAKPVIDMMVAVSTLSEAEHHADRLGDEGYEEVDKKYREIMPERIVMIRRGPDGARKCHVHLMLRGHPAWIRQVAFRDYLRAHPDCAREYAELKRSLAEKLHDDRHAYTMAKTEFVERVTDLAVAEERTLSVD